MSFERPPRLRFCVPRLSPVLRGAEDHSASICHWATPNSEREVGALAHVASDVPSADETQECRFSSVFSATRSLDHVPISMSFKDSADGRPMEAFRNDRRGVRRPAI
jgi:hypothetical protein